MVTQWMVLLLVGSLALGSALINDGEKDKWKTLIPPECCDYEKVLATILATDKNKCGGAIGQLLNSMGSKGEGKTTCAADCALGEHGLLNEDKSIKEPELKKMLLEQTDPDANDILQNALRICFVDLKGGSVKDATCPSGADDLFKCVVRVVATGCPDKLWQADNDQCEGSKDEYWRFLLSTLVHD